MATRLKALDFVRARARRDLELIVIAAREQTRTIGWEWAVGKIVKDCSEVAVTIHDTRTGSRLTHAVPLYLSCANMRKEVLSLANAIRDGRTADAGDR